MPDADQSDDETSSARKRVTFTESAVVIEEQQYSDNESDDAQSDVTSTQTSQSLENDTVDANTDTIELIHVEKDHPLTANDIHPLRNQKLLNHHNTEQLNKLSYNIEADEKLNGTAVVTINDDLQEHSHQQPEARRNSKTRSHDSRLSEHRKPRQKTPGDRVMCVMLWVAAVVVILSLCVVVVLAVVYINR